MDKLIRKAVRCFLIQDKKVVVIKYKPKNKKAGYYDIPGGKIEENELPIKTVSREFKEETGIEILHPIYKGSMIVEYPDRIYDFNIFVSFQFVGEPKECTENFSEWIEINTLFLEEKILSNILILKDEYINGLLDRNLEFKMYIKVEDDEKVLDIKYEAYNKSL